MPPQSRSATGWAGTRIATVERPPSTPRASDAFADATIVSGPGQNRRRKRQLGRAHLSSRQRLLDGGRDERDRHPVFSSLGVEQARHCRLVPGIYRQPIECVGRIGDNSAAAQNVNGVPDDGVVGRVGSDLDPDH